MEEENPHIEDLIIECTKGENEYQFQAPPIIDFLKTTTEYNSITIREENQEVLEIMREMITSGKYQTEQIQFVVRVKSADAARERRFPHERRRTDFRGRFPTAQTVQFRHDDAHRSS